MSMTDAASPEPLRAEVLVVDDDPTMRSVITALLRRDGFVPLIAASAAEGLALAEDHDPRAAIVDLMLPDQPGDALLLQLRERKPDLPVIVISAQDSVARAVDVMRLAPWDYLVKPVEHDRLLRSVQRAVQAAGLSRRVHDLEREVQQLYRFDQIIGSAPRMHDLYERIEEVLANRVTVLITGESGTGKELVAKAIHYHGTRRTGPFVALNCGAIPESLQESELFGHEKGAFTGAVAVHRGRFEQAHGGTLFLDEVGELSPGVQTRLLRVLQEGIVERLGGRQSIAVDVRIIAATHRDLERMVREGTFREDLYYRLMVVPIEVPPLRERQADVPMLVQHFVRLHRERLGTDEVSFDRDALDVLTRYDWPGNVRELENVVQRAMVSRRGGVISVAALPPKLVMRSMGLTEEAETSPDPDGIMPLEAIERRAIEHALRVLDGNVSLAATRLGMGRATLYRKLASYGRMAPGE